MSMIRLLDVYEPTPIRPYALEFLYELMKEREPEINISHHALPSFEEHRQFVTRRPFRCWHLVEHCGTVLSGPAWVGYVSATHFNEIGIVLRKAARGFGTGPAAIRELMRMHQPRPTDPAVRNGHWLANIAPGNEHSRHIFEKLGFKLLQHTYHLPEEEHHATSTEEGKAGST